MARQKRSESKLPIPPQEQPGRCRTCGTGTSTLALQSRFLHRTCRGCGEVVDVDNMVLIRKGEEPTT
jgi:hypothetical protein